jgi:hypothetical protein
VGTAPLRVAFAHPTALMIDELNRNNRKDDPS